MSRSHPFYSLRFKFESTGKETLLMVEAEDKRTAYIGAIARRPELDGADYSLDANEFYGDILRAEAEIIERRFEIGELDAELCEIIHGKGFQDKAPSALRAAAETLSDEPRERALALIKQLEILIYGYCAEEESSPEGLRSNLPTLAESQGDLGGEL